MRRALMLSLVLGLACSGGLLTGCAATGEADSQPYVEAAAPAVPARSLPLLGSWSGDFPVAQLDLLPAGQRQASAGYIADDKTFVAVWRAFQPRQELPEVDFSTQLVVFSRNVTFYNRTSILKVILENGVAQVLAMETMSAMPIEDKVAMALAVIPRAGVLFLASDGRNIEVR